MTKEEYWYWLNHIPGIGRGTLHRLLEEYQTPEAVYAMSDREIKRWLGDGKKAESFCKARHDRNASQALRELAGQKIRFLYPEHPLFPERLKKIPDAPLGLYLKGEMPPEQQKAVAIIGARNCSRYGQEMARFFGRELAKRQIVVVSGLARGIDGMAHRGAVEAGAYTMGVLGCGIDQVYPKENYELFLYMSKRGGILSESGPGTYPAPGLFPQRNRLIAGLSDGVLVIEAMEKSGTFITVDQGLEQGKEIFALPGKVTDVKSAGCNNLIKMGAHLVTEAADIIDILQGNVHNPTENDTGNPLIQARNPSQDKNSLAPSEKIVYSCLRIEPRYLDDIISEAKMAPQDVCKALNQMLLRHWIIESPRNYYAIRL